MRWFAARREASDVSSGGKVPRRPFKAVIFALACLAGLGFSAGERFEARADDGGMMAFLLKGNGNGRARIAAPQIRFVAPAVIGRGAVAHRATVARHKSRASRQAKARQRLRHDRKFASARRVRAEAALTQVSLGPIDTKVTSQTLALKAAAAAARPENPHFQDRTLRRGDIVATASGLRVFLGAEHFPYRPRDFAPISRARHVAQRGALEAMDRSLRGIRAVAHTAKVRAVKSARRALTKFVAHQERRRGVGARIETSASPRPIAMAYAETSAPARAVAESPAIKAIGRVIRRIELPASKPENVAAAHIVPIAAAPVARRRR